MLLSKAEHPTLTPGLNLQHLLGTSMAGQGLNASGSKVPPAAMSHSLSGEGVAGVCVGKPGCQWRQAQGAREAGAGRAPVLRKRSMEVGVLTSQGDGSCQEPSTIKPANQSTSTE